MKFLRALSRYFDDFLILLGCIAILAGIYQINVIAVYFAGGVMLITWGVIIGIIKRGRL